MSSSRPTRTKHECPLCGRPAAASHRPFCSRGCKDRDLLNWLGDAYRVPGPPAAPEDFAGAEDGLDRQR
ncbi:MAG TPA: DNA gyrase inhibitor YacG [Allosphingosinicella sp.]|nr:DNA gyrase inhibitor YacG [Allosphingosinicella sp.]